MSASKKKKSKKKSKKKANKLRVETTKNVLSKKEQEIKDSEKTEQKQDAVEDELIKEEVAKDSINNEEKNEVPRAEQVIKNIEELDDVKETSGTELVKVKSEDEEKPEYVKEMLAKKKKKMIIFVTVVAIFLLIILLSTVFAMMNSGSTSIAKGIKIKYMELSNLNVEQAEETVKRATDKELIPEIKIKYDDYEVEFNPEQIEFEYEIEETVNDAYNYGKTDNIVVNNYKLLFATLFGKKLDLKYSYNEELLNSFVDEVNSNLPGVVINPTYYIEEDELVVSKGIDGISIDKEKLKEEILDNIVSRNAFEMNDDSFKQVIELSPKETKADKIDMSKIYEDIHTEPKDAYFELDPYELHPDVNGVDLVISVEDAQKQVKNEDKDEYAFKLNITKANKTISDLGLEAFPYLISEFSTKYDASNINRSTNLEIAAEKINGTVLLPGEEFSYNKVVGKRTVEEGYKDAKIYADGGVVDGLAGGICQISSTLYNAVLLANLEITERHNHTYTTSYLPAGRDATVVWGTKDFKFVNSRNYPIKIEASVKNGIAEFKMHGIAEETEYEVKIIPRVQSSIPFATVYEDDPTLAPGQEIVKQAGHSGYKVSTTKEIRLNGVVVSSEVITSDTYSPMKKIIRRGPVIEPLPEVPAI